MVVVGSSPVRSDALVGCVGRIVEERACGRRVVGEDYRLGLLRRQAGAQGTSRQRANGPIGVHGG